MGAWAVLHCLILLVPQAGGWQVQPQRASFPFHFLVVVFFNRPVARFLVWEGLVTTSYTARAFHKYQFFYYFQV